MKRFSLVLAAFLMFGSIVFAQDAVIFEKKGKLGVKENNKVVVKAMYEDIKPLNTSSYIVKKNNQYGLISRSGMPIIPEVYDDFKFYNDNIYLVKMAGRWGLIDRFSQVVVPIEYLDFKFVSDGLYEVKNESQKIGLINKYGITVLPASYDKVEPFMQGSFIVEANGKCGVINEWGEFLIPTLYDGFSKVENSEMYNVKREGKIGLMDSSCKILFDASYDKIEECPLGLALYQGDRLGFYTKNGKVVEPAYSRVLFFQPEFGLAVVKQGNKLGFVTSQGLVVPPQYENVSRFSGKGVAFVEKDGKLMAINVQGKEMILQEIMGAGNRPPQ